MKFAGLNGEVVVIVTPWVALRICVLGEIEAAAGSAIVIEIVAEADPKIDPVAVIVTEVVAPETVGIPEIAPVEVFSSNPAGKVPLEIA